MTMSTQTKVAMKPQEMDGLIAVCTDDAEH